MREEAERNEAPGSDTVGWPDRHRLVEAGLEIRSLFPTPLIIAPLEEHAELDAELTRCVLRRVETHASVAKSNLGGWQSDTDFESWSGPAGRAVLDAARRLGNMVTAIKDQDGLRRTEIPWRINSWANVNSAGNANEMHTHAGAYWSGAYYVDDGGEPDSAVGGEFEMLDPRGVVPTMYAPHLKIGISSCITAGLSEYAAPRPGSIFLFPSWLFHGVRPYRGNRKRISIAFNLCL